MKKCNCCAYSLFLKWLINPLFFLLISVAQAAVSPLPPGFLSIYGTDKGLSQSTVYDVAKDARGFIWVATGEGLNRFDGHRFVHYHKSVTTPGQLSESIIRSLMPAKDSGIWVGTNKYIWYKPFFSERFQKYAITDVTKGMIHKPMWENGNTLWGITHHKGIFSLNRKNGLVEWYPFPSGIQTNIHPVLRDGKFYMISQAGQLIEFNPKSRKYTEKFPGITGCILLSIDDQNQLLILKKEGLYRLEFPGSKLIPVKVQIPNPDQIERFHLAGDYLWTFDKNTELFCSNIRDGKRHKIGYPDIPFSTSFEIFEIKSDAQGNVWIAADGPGLIKANAQRLKFKHLKTYQSASIPSRDFVRCIQEDAHGCLLVGTFQEGVTLFSPDLNSYKFLHIPGNGSFSVNQMTRDQKQRVCLATSEGLYYLSEKHELIPIQKGGAFHYFFRVYEDEYLQYGNQFLSLNSGKLLPGYSETLFRFSTQIGPESWFLADRNSGAYLVKGRQFHHPEPIRHFSELRIFQLLPYSDSVFVMSTDAGVIFINRNLQIVKTLSAKDGLPDQHIYGFVKDKNGVLWGSSNRGIFSIHPNGNIQNYSYEEGMAFHEFNSQAMFKSRNGNFYFGGTNGCVYFNPDEITRHRNEHSPSVWLTEILVNGETQSIEKNIPLLHLKPGRYDLALGFAVTDYFIPEKNNVQIWISSLTSGWKTTKNKGHYKIDGLAAGSYAVWARAINSDGLIGPETKLAEISIALPFWKRLWFWTFIGTAVLIISILLTKRWVKRKSEEELNRLKKEEELEKVRKQIYRDLHDEIGSGLSKIQLLSDLALIEPESETNKTIEEVKETATDVTRKLREIVWAMKGGNENLPALLLRLQQIMEDLFQHSRIRHRVFIPDEIPSVKLDPVLIRNVLLAYREILTNIIKHSASTDISIVAGIVPNGIEIIIEDNGVGLKNGYEKAGNGVEIIQERMEEIKGKITWESAPGKGTKVKLEIPLESHKDVTKPD